MAMTEREQVIGAGSEVLASGVRSGPHARSAAVIDGGRKDEPLIPWRHSAQVARQHLIVQGLDGSFERVVVGLQQRDRGILGTAATLEERSLVDDREPSQKPRQ